MADPKQFEMRKLFNEVDIDHSGLITFFEFKKCMKKINVDPEQPSVKMAFSVADTDNSGKINFQEFCTVIETMKKYDCKTLRGVFEVIFDLIDKDHSGDISGKEVERLLTACGVTPNGSSISSFMKNVDKNRDGKISRAEFLTLAQ
ncbi:centrin-2, putative [Entamoeba invadens IP1]|uniref:centrin-2, putative n=1 Tax=Entamoeba invadens IP1 TaxID=370355 RepID=UPI0002C3FA51|nr:centrin-2, putative [Entamoeba invadens IP1]ELP85447.1 centrin-2, putative [Entamoeba invadens IP1]|eukprot:XP_004184793.1 centrin-2, putative [Entamoeba invadens IP1]